MASALPPTHHRPAVLCSQAWSLLCQMALAVLSSPLAESRGEKDLAFCIEVNTSESEDRVAIATWSLE